jgi:hypothetical protein
MWQIKLGRSIILTSKFINTLYIFIFCYKSVLHTVYFSTPFPPTNITHTYLHGNPHIGLCSANLEKQETYCIADIDLCFANINCLVAAWKRQTTVPDNADWEIHVVQNRSMEIEFRGDYRRLGGTTKLIYSF